MEKKMIEKIDKAIDMYNAKAEKFNNDVRKFKSEMFTKEIKDMVYELCHNLRGSYTERYIHLLFDDIRFNIYEDCYFDVDVCQKSLRASGLPKNSDYDDRILSSLKYYIESYEENLKCFNCFVSHAEEIISIITKLYEEKVNSQMNEIDKILQALSGEDPEVKHIKVTVEWVN